MRWLASLFFVLVLGLMGCSETTGTGGSAGDGGNGGGGIGGDAGHGGVGGDGCAEPVADVTGDWKTASEVVSDNCDGRQDWTFIMTMTQDDNIVTAQTPELTFNGTICGDEIQMGGSFPEDEGTVTVDAMLVVSADGNSMQGSDEWTWTDGVESCSGSDDLSATRTTDLCEGVENGTACSGGACLDGTCTALVTVTGLVDYGGAPPGEGSQITVSVDGTSLNTTTNVSGGFSFEVFPGEWFFVTSKEDTVWGQIAFISVPDTGLSNLQLMVGFDEEVAVIEEECGVEIDEAKGVVGFYFFPVSGAGGETVTLSVPYGGALTEDADGNCVASEIILPGAANPFGGMELEFFNVDLTENLAVTPIAPEGYECALEHPGTVFPVRASFVSGGDVRCGAVP